MTLKLFKGGKMKKLLVALISVLFTVSAYAATININFKWDKNTDADLAGYRLYQTDVSGDYSQAILIETIALDANSVISPVDVDCDKYFVMTAYDTADQESGYSNQVMMPYIDTNNPAPGIPKGLIIDDYIIINIY